MKVIRQNYADQKQFIENFIGEAKLVADLIQGRENPFTAVYDPNRFLYYTEAIKEDLNANKQYVDYVTAGDIHSPDDLAPGQGGLMRHGLSALMPQGFRH